jgi:hypothetical protein
VRDGQLMSEMYLEAYSKGRPVEVAWQEKGIPCSCTLAITLRSDHTFKGLMVASRFFSMPWLKLFYMNQLLKTTGSKSDIVDIKA